MRIGISATDRPSRSASRSTASTVSRPAAASPSEASAARSNGTASSSPTSGASPSRPPASRSCSAIDVAAESVCRAGAASCSVPSWTAIPIQTQSTSHTTNRTSATTCSVRRRGVSAKSFMPPTLPASTDPGQPCADAARCSARHVRSTSASVVRQLPTASRIAARPSTVVCERYASPEALTRLHRRQRRLVARGEPEDHQRQRRLGHHLEAVVGGDQVGDVLGERDAAADVLAQALAARRCAAPPTA